MKNFVAVLFAASSIVASAGNPVSRIVSLLQGLKEKLEQDLDKEKDLYENYRCWHMSTTVTKKASNAAAENRIASQKQYIADIDAGKIEFTTERLDLEKQIKQLTEDLAQAKTMRDSENKDFKAAEKEMNMAIAALKEAIKTMEEGTKGSLAQTKSHLGMLAARHSIQRVMSLGRGLFDAADQKYLQKMMNGDVPDVDWKKLNRKATFKAKYNKRSGKIIETLNDLQKTFETNLDTATKNEADNLASYEKLKDTKQGILDSTEKAREDMTLEGDARGQSKGEAQNEVDALEAQVVADKKFIEEADASFKIKKQEWAGREELRNKEILAMGQAIAVLHSDDARDQFKTSFKSQGYSLIQESHKSDAAKAAARLVSTLASKSGDVALLQLASLAALGNAAIDKVVVKIDEIVKAKKEEEDADLKKKQKCEVDLSAAAVDARKAALDMDSATEDIARETQKIAELKEEIKDQEAKKKALESQIKEMEVQRKRENEDFKSAKIDDEKAVTLIESAIAIVTDWKNAKKSALISKHQTVKPTAATALIQVHVSAKQNPDFVVAAGQAPIPPPATWEAGATYGGASGEQNGIVGILEMVKEDVHKDIKAGEDDEADALKEFEKGKADLEDEIKATDKALNAYKADVAAKEITVEEKKTARSTSKGLLEPAVALYNSYKPGCDFLLVNFDTRTTARQTEIDGLQKAKAILQGADFGKAS